ncbi:hypothetical protein [Paraburkholderia sp.]|uniref:hypothetical protein n=1 Tax=Paraburkholderia sp. TaxID=1926495 RepID=UPI00239FEF3D|nr:hypothetical protein [Paraburkholderia sp.]MDE1180087.1 hypothetical protein [Paraburkholderia sp.]
MTAIRVLLIRVAAAAEHQASVCDAGALEKELSEVFNFFASFAPRFCPDPNGILGPRFDA